MPACSKWTWKEGWFWVEVGDDLGDVPTVSRPAMPADVEPSAAVVLYDPSGRQIALIRPVGFRLPGGTDASR